MELKNLVGVHMISGVEYTAGSEGETNIKFCIDGVTYIAKEDPDDGYRSYMEDLEETSEPCRNTFPGQVVFCIYSDDSHDDILRMYNIQTGKLIMTIGTKDYEDYYPCCIMEYYPENMPCNKQQ